MIINPTESNEKRFWWIKLVILSMKDICNTMLLGTDIFETIWWCCCHTIQLCIKDALKVKLGQVSLGKVLDKCWKIATLINRSESSREEVACKPEMPEVSFVMPIRPIAVLWNSSFSGHRHMVWNCTRSQRNVGCSSSSKIPETIKNSNQGLGVRYEANNSWSNKAALEHQDCPW